MNASIHGNTTLVFRRVLGRQFFTFLSDDGWLEGDSGFHIMHINALFGLNLKDKQLKI